jgi:hypothetical protein
MGWLILGAVLWVCYKMSGIRVEVSVEKDDTEPK